MDEFHEVIVVGAGASGLMCGYFLGKKGWDAVILDKNAAAGKKLLATGNGRCNFTNRRMGAECYFGEAGFVEAVLARVDDCKAVRIFEEIGMLHRERDGYCYPYSGQASTVVQLLTDACKEQGVGFRFETKVTKVVHNDGEYVIFCSDKVKYRCKNLVLATGGKAYESLGGDGSGYQLCRRLSHQVTPLYPGLTGLRAEGREWKALAGVRMQGEISLYIEGGLVKKESGEIQLVKDGISGIPVFQLCRLAAMGLAEQKKVTAVLDFFPSMDREQLEQWLSLHGIDKLAGLVHTKWCDVVRKRAGGSVRETARLLKRYEIPIFDTFGLGRAQVTAGGVSTGEVCPDTMQSKLHKGLYLIGELLDVDGICGGYNLHFAWSTAYICAEGIERMKRDATVSSV